MKLDGSTYATNPLYHLSAYGLQNPWVQWAIEHDAYQPWMCPECIGTGKRNGDECRVCEGSGHRKDRAPYMGDFGDKADLAMARRMFPGLRVDGHVFPCRGEFAGSKRRCTCVLR